MVKRKMDKFYFFPLLVGIISALGQTLLLRELMIEVNGNEVIFSIFLSLWLFFVAFGTLIFKFTKIKKISIHFLLSILIFVMPLQFLLIRILAGHFSFISGLLIDIASVVLLALIILAPGCILVGFLFPLNCKLIENRSKPVHTIYLLECIGMIIGGILFYILISFFRNFTILLLGGLICFSVLFLILHKKVFLFGTIVFIFLTIFSNKIFLHNYSKRYSPNQLTFSQDSKYGRFDVSEQAGQKNYYWNGVLFANSENRNYAEEMVNFVLLQHPVPKKLLLVGGLLDGYLEKILDDNSAEKIDYLELENNIIKQSKLFSEKDERINFIRADVILFLQNNNTKYDLIFIDFPDPSSIFLNRFYTIEFFRLIKSHLSSDFGTAAITISNGENFLLPELAVLNATIYQTFSEVFKNHAVIPAEKNIFLGSENRYISNNVDSLTKRMNKREKSRDWFNQALIFDTCNDLRLKNFKNSIEGKKRGINSNLNPLGYLFTLQFWAKHQDVKLENIIIFLQQNKISIFLGVIFLMLLISFISSRLQNKKIDFVNDFNVFSISFVAFVMQIILLYIFQMKFGYVYFIIAVFTISFMVGLTFGFIVSEKIKIKIPMLFFLNFLFILALYLLIEQRLPNFLYFIFNVLLAFFEGIILANLLTEKLKKEPSNSHISFYFFDTLGATFGGMVFGILFLPVFSIKTNILFILFVVLVNLIFRTGILQKRRAEK